MNKLMFISGLSLAFFACSTSTSTKDEVVELTTLEQKVSYGYALNSAANLRKADFGVDKAAFIQGVLDGLDTTRTPLLSQEEMQAAAAFMAAESKKPGMTKTASGLMYEVLVMGKGPKPTAENTVSVNYEGTLIDGTIFDSSYERGEPATFPLKGVIPGWTEGLQLMPIGSTFRFIIPADLAYGNNPPPSSSIQPGSTLVFKVELLKIEKK